MHHNSSVVIIDAVPQGSMTISNDIGLVYDMKAIRFIICDPLESKEFLIF